MVKKYDKASLNLELALLIMLLALSVLFGLTWMGSGIERIDIVKLQMF